MSISSKSWPLSISTNADLHYPSNDHADSNNSDLYRFDEMARPPKKGFLDLPAEIRLQIYGHLFETDPWCKCKNCNRPRRRPHCCCHDDHKHQKHNHCARAQHTTIFGTCRRIREEAQHFHESNTFTIRLPAEGKIFAEDDTDHGPGTMTMSRLQTLLDSKVTDALGNSVTTLVFRGAPWRWLRDRLDGPIGFATDGDHREGQIRFDFMSVYTDLCKKVFKNVRHVRFHLDFPFDARFRRASYKDLLAVTRFPNLKTLHIQLHIDHAWLPELEAESAERTKDNIHLCLHQCLVTFLGARRSGAINIKTETLYEIPTPKATYRQVCRIYETARPVESLEYCERNRAYDEYSLYDWAWDYGCECWRCTRDDSVSSGSSTRWWVTSR